MDGNKHGIDPCIITNMHSSDIKGILIWSSSFILQTNERSIRWQNFISTCAVHI